MKRNSMAPSSTYPSFFLVASSPGLHHPPPAASHRCTLTVIVSALHRHHHTEIGCRRLHTTVTAHHGIAHLHHLGAEHPLRHEATAAGAQETTIGMVAITVERAGQGAGAIARAGVAVIAAGAGAAHEAGAHRDGTLGEGVRHHHHHYRRVEAEEDHHRAEDAARAIVRIVATVAAEVGRGAGAGIGMDEGDEGVMAAVEKMRAGKRRNNKNNDNNKTGLAALTMAINT
ncbi:MAG: hypothetical protein LQ340_003399 [Diploschistes diacapsis]|nr:MAG: hypothetical protein LQ340_003399 [Diploschistes diacapsis]